MGDDELEEGGDETSVRDLLVFTLMVFALGGLSYFLLNVIEHGWPKYTPPLWRRLTFYGCYGLFALFAAVYFFSLAKALRK